LGCSPHRPSVEAPLAWGGFLTGRPTLAGITY
jgi:hypothetical protein